MAGQDAGDGEQDQVVDRRRLFGQGKAHLGRQALLAGLFQAGTQG